MISRKLNRRRLVQGSTGLATAAAASTMFHVPMINAQEKAPVVFWTTHTGLGWEAFQQIVTDYNAQSDQFAAEAVQRPPASETDSASLITAVRGGVGPDVYLLDRFIVGERAAAGLLEDITGLIEDAGDNTDLAADYAGFAAEEAQYDGGIYALPFDSDVRALFYNVKLLEEAGADMTKWDRANGPMLFDDIVEVLQSLNVEEGGNLTQAGFVPYYSQGWHYTYGFAFGGEFFDYENCQVTPDNEQVIAGMDWARSYCETVGFDKLYAFIQNAMRTGAPPTDSPFIQGRLGAIISGNWEFAGFREYAPDTEYDFTFIPIPEEGAESISWAGGWSAVMPVGAKNPEGGYDFMRYLCGEQGQRTYVEINNNLPTRNELLTDTELLGENLAWFAEQFPTTRNRPVLPVGAKYWDDLTAGWQEIYLGQNDPATAMAAVKESTQAELDNGGYCPIAAPE